MASNLSTLSLFITALALVSVGAYSLRFKEFPAAKSFSTGMIISAAWVVAYAMDLASADLPTKAFWYRLYLSTAPFIPVVIALMVTEYSRSHTWITQQRLKALLALPLLNLIFIWVEPLFPLARYNLHINPNPQFPVVLADVGTWGILMVAFNYSLLLASIVSFVQLLQKSQGDGFWQTLLWLLGLLIPALADMLFSLAKYSLISGYDLAPNLMLITAGLYGWALFRYQWLSITPIARSIAVDEMSDAMLVVDLNERLVDFNRTAAKALGVSGASISQPIAVLLPQWAAIKAEIKPNVITRMELELEHQGQLTTFELAANNVTDQRGQRMGFVITMRDISSRKRTGDDLKKRLKELEIINTTSLAAASQLDLVSLVALTGQKLEEAFNVKSVFIAILDPVTNMIETPFWTIDHKRVYGEPMALGQGLTSVVLSSGKTLLIETEFNRAAPKIAASLIMSETQDTPKTWLGVPITANGETMGVVSVQDYEHEYAFSPDDIRMLETIAASIGIAVQNARLYKNVQKELGERVYAEADARQRAEQMAAINSIGRAITAGLELDSVLKTLREQCQQIVPNLDIFSVDLLDERGSKPAVLAFFDRRTNQAGRAHDARIKQTGLGGQVISNRQTIYISDTLAEETLPLTGSMDGAEPSAARSYLGIPLLMDEKIIGVLSVESYLPGAFSKEQIDILETVALQAAVAIQNAKLYEKTRQRMDELSMLYEVSAALSSNLNLETILQKLFEICKKVLPMDAFYIGLYDSETHMLSHPLFWDNGKLLRTGSRDIRLTPGLGGEVLLSRKTIYLPDALDPEARKKYQIIHAGGVQTRCYVGVPMIAHDQVVGILSMQTIEAEVYTPEQILLLETIAQQAAIAIENSRLYHLAQEELYQRRLAQKTLEQVNQSLHFQLNQEEARQVELREQAVRDELTGLHNRRYLNESLQQLLEQANKEKQPVSVLMIDIDNFKTFNDTYGHPAGDTLLQGLATLLRQSTRASDITCRYGGEEFIIALPDTPLDIALKRAENIRKKFSELAIVYNNIELCGTISIGVAGSPTHGTIVEEIIMQADQAMYAAKFEGRNKVIVWKK